MMVLGKVAVKSALWTRHRDIVEQHRVSLNSKYDQNRPAASFLSIDCWSFDKKRPSVERGRGILFAALLGILAPQVM
jgi:hypothetical protein